MAFIWAAFSVRNEKHAFKCTGFQFIILFISILIMGPIHPSNVIFNSLCSLGLSKVGKVQKWVLRKGEKLNYSDGKYGGKSYLKQGYSRLNNFKLGLFEKIIKFLIFISFHSMLPYGFLHRYIIVLSPFKSKLAQFEIVLFGTINYT